MTREFLPAMCMQPGLPDFRLKVAHILFEFPLKGKTSLRMSLPPVTSARSVPFGAESSPPNTSDEFCDVEACFRVPECSRAPVNVYISSKLIEAAGDNRDDSAASPTDEKSFVFNRHAAFAIGSGTAANAHRDILTVYILCIKNA